MSESDWTKQGGTLSHKNACKEFELTEDQVFSAMKLGKLQYRQNSAHGNPYFKLLRAEVELLAIELHGIERKKELGIKYKLQTINTEINSLKRKLASLEKQKIKLIEIQKKEETLIAVEIFPSSFRCSCGHESHFFENSIREMKNISKHGKARFVDGSKKEHIIIFFKGKPIEIICPDLGKVDINNF